VLILPSEPMVLADACRGRLYFARSFVDHVLEVAHQIKNLGSSYDSTLGYDGYMHLNFEL
jgi:hypothetical protein